MFLCFPTRNAYLIIVLYNLHTYHSIDELYLGITPTSYLMPDMSNQINLNRYKNVDITYKLFQDCRDKYTKKIFSKIIHQYSLIVNI